MRRLLSLFALCILGAVSCQKKEVTPKTLPTVVVSVPPYVYFVKKIAHGHYLDVQSIVPPQSDPHTFEPSPREVEKIQDPILSIDSGRGIR